MLSLVEWPKFQPMGDFADICFPRENKLHYCRVDFLLFIEELVTYEFLTWRLVNCGSYRVSRQVCLKISYILLCIAGMLKAWLQVRRYRLTVHFESKCCQCQVKHLLIRCRYPFDVLSYSPPVLFREINYRKEQAANSKWKMVTSFYAGNWSLSIDIPKQQQQNFDKDMDVDVMVYNPETTRYNNQDYQATEWIITSHRDY